jgi:O-antigen ligase
MSEYVYYLLVVYAMMGSALGIAVGFLGIAMHFAVAALCVLRRGSRVVFGDLAMAAPILCAASFVAIQMFVHNESLLHRYVRTFVPWVLDLIIVVALTSRPGFIRRFGTVALLIGLSVLPFMDLGDNSRATVDVESTLRNANALAEWFGFCALVFTVRGLETRKVFGRWISFAIALFSLFIVGLTVSRGTLAACALAIVVALRRQLRRSFLPILALIGLSGIAFSLGVFDQAVGQYMERGFEDTGRAMVWPLIIERIRQEPITGVGVSQISTSVNSQRDITPHNSVLFVALGGGLITLLFFLGYWISAARGAWRGTRQRDANSPYLAPLLAFCLVTMLFTSQGFMPTYSIVSVGACLHYFGARQSR